MDAKYTKTGIILILILGVAIGGVHGFYAANSSARMHSLSGNELCNGPYIRESIYAEEGDTIMMSYKTRISRGNTGIRITDPDGSIAYERSDSKPIFRQHSIRVKEGEEGEWTFYLDCERAEIAYNIDFKIMEDDEDRNQP